MSESSKWALSIANAIRDEVAQIGGPPDEGLPALGELVLPFSVVRGTRGYIEKVAHQINGAYENGWFDACAVMMRKLVETLIIETFEYRQIAHLIRDANGEYMMLEELIKAALSEQTLGLGRETKRALPKIKSVGDQSAHGRRFTARRQDIEQLRDGFRIAVEDLVLLAGLK